MTMSPEPNVHEGLARLRAAFEHPDGVAERCLGEGRAVVRYLGTDLPREMFLAAGVVPIRLASDAPRDSEVLEGLPVLGRRGRALVARIARQLRGEAFAITHADNELAQLFATLRELGPRVPFATAWVEMIDLMHLPHDASLEYNQARLRQLAHRLQVLAGTSVDTQRLRAAVSASNAQQRALAALNAARVNGRITGSQMLAAIGAAMVLPPDEHVTVVRELLEHVDRLPLRGGRRLFLSGSAHDDGTLYALLEDLGTVVVGEGHDTGQRWFEQSVDDGSDPWCALAQPTLRAPLAMRPGRDASLQGAIRASGAEVVLHIVRQGDEAAAWDAPERERDCAALRVPCLRLETRAGEDADSLRERVARLLAGTSARAPLAAGRAPATAAGAAKEGERSRKSLASVAEFGRYQRAWFAGIRERVAAGEPFAVVNADAPQEILRAFDVPFVVNQWWASIVAAKQQSRKYLELLRAQGFPVDAEAYSAQGLAACFDADREDAPWGGLPRPALLVAVAGTDATLKIFAAWAQASGAELALFSRSVECRKAIPPRWWDELPNDWDRVLEPARLDLMEAELRGHISGLARMLGRTFSRQRFIDIMHLVNEQEAWYRRTRDLIASSARAPVSIVDTMPATMVPQWHRGTAWGRDAARAFHDEVAARVARGECVCPNERVRLMWIGRGLWSEMGFYQKWEHSHGAVFVWSMYLALAADGYIRMFDRGRDPLRALAARFVTMGDELRMPTWGGAWHVHEAHTHRVDGAVALADADPFVVRALREAGIPVLTLPFENFGADPAASSAAERSVTAFIEGPAHERAGLRLRQARG